MHGTMCNKVNNHQTVFSRDGLRTIDSDAVEYYGLPSIVLMENAARGAAACVLNVADDAQRQNVIIICGCGNNGGDGYAVARYLANDGCVVSILQIGKPKTNDAILNATVAEKMGIPISPWTPNTLKPGALVIDALFGTGLDRTIEGDIADAIHAINESSSCRISLDIPSGLDCDSGFPLGCCIKATMTVTFVGIKVGFLNSTAEQYLGTVKIVDIGCPACLLNTYGFSAT
jgi:NAD(P)H-hydrate epimerase